MPSLYYELTVSINKQMKNTWMHQRLKNWLFSDYVIVRRRYMHEGHFSDCPSTVRNKMSTKPRLDVAALVSVDTRRLLQVNITEELEELLHTEKDEPDGVDVELL